MGSLDGKVAIVTGGSKGIGRGMATAYVKAGAAVVITGRTQETLETTRAELLALPGARALALVADGCDEEAVKEVVRRTGEEFGRIDILVNNAQTFRYGIPLEQHTIDDFHVVYESGVFAYWRYMVACLPYLKDTQGTIINMASGAGITGMANHGAYGSNKEAIRGLTRTAATEWGQYGITANAVTPSVWSEGAAAWAEAEPETYQASLKMIPLGHYGDPEKDCGGLGVFLAQPEGKYLTGMTFNVDGGYWMRP